MAVPGGTAADSQQKPLTTIDVVKVDPNLPLSEMGENLDQLTLYGDSQQIARH